MLTVLADSQTSNETGAPDPLDKKPPYPGRMRSRKSSMEKKKLGGRER